MKRVWVLVFLLVCTVTFVQTEHTFSQTQDKLIQAEIVEVPGGMYQNILPEQLRAMLQMKDFVFINVHVPYESEIEKTDLFIPYNEMEQNVDNLPYDKETKIVIYCRTDRMSIIAAHTLVKLGYKSVWNLKGGMTAWRQAGYPLIEK